MKDTYLQMVSCLIASTTTMFENAAVDERSVTPKFSYDSEYINEIVQT